MNEFEHEQEDLAASEAAKVGGSPSSEGPESDDPAQEPLLQAGEGESEGFEQSERELVDHASHGDQHAARHAESDQFDESEDSRAAPAGEADEEFSSEVDSDRP